MKVRLVKEVTPDNSFRTEDETVWEGEAEAQVSGLPLSVALLEGKVYMFAFKSDGWFVYRETTSVLEIK